MKRTLLSLVSLMLLVAIVFSLGACAAPAPDTDDGDVTLGVPGADTTDNTDKEDEAEKDSELTGSNDVLDVPEVLEPDTIPATEGLVFRPNYVYDDEGKREVASYYVFDYVEKAIGAETNIYIPYTYEGKPVVSIGYAAFDGASAVSITLPKTLLKISQYAFRNCASLASLDIPALVTDIALDAFLGTESLASFTVDDANAKFADVNGAIVIPAESKIFRAGNDTVIPADGSITSIGMNAFSGLGISEIVIPDAITTMGDNAFAHCKNLNAITFSANLHEIAQGAFLGCTALSELSIPDWISDVKNSAFRGCTALNTLVIPTSMRALDSYAFEGCTALTNLTIYPGLSIIGPSAFKNCTKLSSVSVPSTVQTIDTAAFWGCTSLSSFEFVGASSITLIGTAAFYGCASLTYFVLPASICSSQGKVLDFAFYGCCTIGADGSVNAIKVKLNGDKGFYWGDSWDRCHIAIVTVNKTQYEYTPYNVVQVK